MRRLVVVFFLLTMAGCVSISGGQMAGTLTGNGMTGLGLPFW
jgi:hypothetical protein